jgi:hypothetical protein
MATSFPSSLDALTNPTSGDPLNSPSHSAQHANANDAIEALEAKVGVDSSAVTSSHTYKIAQLETNGVTLAGSQTLTNKTLTSPTINTATISGAVLKETEETWNVSATAATGTVNMDVVTASAWLYTSNASANWTFNFRGDSGTTLASLLATNDSITVAFAVTQGTTAYYPTAFQIDGTSVTPKWLGGTAPAAGNASSVDLYTFTIIKTAATPTYTVLASQSQFK